MSHPLFSVVVPTIGRASLPLTLASIPKDVEILVVADAFEPDEFRLQNIQSAARWWGAHCLELDAGFHDTGSSQIQYGYREARGDYILNCGDDDIYEPFAFETMKRAICSLKEPAPLMFRTVLHPGPQRGNTAPVVLWHERVLERGKMTGQSFVVPNDQARIGSWLPDLDVGFITSTLALWGGRVEWRTELISQCY